MADELASYYGIPVRTTDLVPIGEIRLMAPLPWRFVRLSDLPLELALLYRAAGGEITYPVVLARSVEDARKAIVELHRNRSRE